MFAHALKEAFKLNNVKIQSLFKKTVTSMAAILIASLEDSFFIGSKSISDRSLESGDVAR